MMAVKLVLGLLLVFFMVTFSAKNQQTVDLVYYGDFKYSINQWMVILASVGLGVLVTSLGLGYSLLKEKTKGWRLARKVKAIEKELKDIKQRPIPDTPGVYPAPKEQPGFMLEEGSKGRGKALPERAGGI